MTTSTSHGPVMRAVAGLVSKMSTLLTQATPHDEVEVLAETQPARMGCPAQQAVEFGLNLTKRSRGSKPIIY